MITLSLAIPKGVGLTLGETPTLQFTIPANDGANEDGVRPYAFFELESDRVNEGRVVRAFIELDRDLDLNSLPSGLAPIQYCLDYVRWAL